jgi:hypothetical protein
MIGCGRFRWEIVHTATEQVGEEITLICYTEVGESFKELMGKRLGVIIVREQEV